MPKPNQTKTSSIKKLFSRRILKKLRAPSGFATKTAEKVFNKIFENFRVPSAGAAEAGHKLITKIFEKLRAPSGLDAKTAEKVFNEIFENFRVPSAGAAEAGRENFQKSGFTLIELLIVIAILGILATVSFSAYSETRKSADISLQTDTIIAKLREAKGQSQNTTQNSDNEIFCTGFAFTIGENPKESIQEIQVPYLNRFTPCNTSKTPVFTGLNDNNLNITDIEFKSTNLTPVDSDSFYILYYPPKGEFLMYTDLGQPASKNLESVSIYTSLNGLENKATIKILNSGVIQKELIANDNNDYKQEN